MIQENITKVKRNIEEACKRAGRSADEVTLIAVSKTKPVELLQEAYEAGARNFGENKVQEILEKHPVLPKDITWHMIGHLQRNKVKQVVDKVSLIHSVDSVRLAEQIEMEAAKKGLISNILLEVNVAKEESKFGFTTDEVYHAIMQVKDYPHVRVNGLMTIAPFVENAEKNRKIFNELFQLYVDMKSKNIDNVTMSALSMGMTGDYEVAIEEGATMIRVGTGIFGAR